MKMKALKSFNHPQTNVRVKHGSEFDVDDGTAREMENLGIAAKVASVKMDDARKAKIDAPLQNKAADTGPLASPGGETGGENVSSSSPADQAHQTRRSKRSKAKPE